jgi:NADH-quinone oxidoreductase subunit L
METCLLLLIFLPSWGALGLATVGRRLPRRAAEWFACATILGSLSMAVTVFLRAGQSASLFTFFEWFRVGGFSASMSIYLDPLSSVMALMVTFVSGIIHLYSVSFMRKDRDYVRYFCYLNLFVFSMLVITFSDNLLFLYLGWEGVGFCSYALIGFWYTEEEKATAGRKAIIMTRIGDIAFGIAIASFFVLFGQISISAINAQASSLSLGAATLLSLLLLWAAVGKSAQLPLLTWLPDAMAGPSPVSALIHAATMVTAGVYLLMRLFPVIALSSSAMLIIAIVAAFTGLFSALAALGQTDIKRILAYSTISQVSYMLLGVGAGDIAGGLFHLFSHAFFKALLFLTAGCVIQALNEEHDIYKMGNLRHRLPVVFWLFLAGALSLGAIPPFGGFFSKDQVLLSTLSHPEPIYKFLFAVGAGAAFITVLYTFRMFFIAFLDRPGEGKERIPLPRFMVWVLAPLAVLSLGAGVMNFPAAFDGNAWLSRFLAAVPGAVPSGTLSFGLQRWMEIISGAANGGMMILAYFMFRPAQTFMKWPTPVAWGKNARDLFFSAFYLDRLYYFALVYPYRFMARVFWIQVDERGIDDRLDDTGGVFGRLSLGARLWTTGRLSTYLLMLLLGFTAILAILGAGWFNTLKG